jgi:ATP-binding protein involved in chromosome partitioning
MELNEQQVLEALSRVNYPGHSRDIVSLGVVRDVRIEAGAVQLKIAVRDGQAESARHIVQEAEAALRDLPGVRSVKIDLPTGSGSPSLRVVEKRDTRPSPAVSGAVDANLVPGVKRIVAVASGKGGVGKSTVAVNLAVALAAEGASVGLLDVDVYGPSLPLLLGMPRAEPEVDAEAGQLIPFERCGVRVMSLGFLVDPDSAVIWRGPMVMKAIEQLLREVAWGALDFLILDMPPGTGDAQLTVSQRLQLAGAVIVTTPQDVALADAVKGVAMFRKVGVPVLGIIENMSYFVCPHCSERTEIFSHGGGRAQATQLEVPFLGEIPLDPMIRETSDAGDPIVASRPDSVQAKAFRAVAREIARTLTPEGAPAEPALSEGRFDRFRNARNVGEDPA